MNCSLKASDQPSNTQQLTEVVIKALREHEVEIEIFRIADMSVLPGVVTDLGEGDDWPQIHQALLKSEILVIATPTWVGHPSSLAQRVLERMDAMISETDAEERPVAYNRTAGVVVTGNEDGAHHVISEINGALVDIGYTIAPQGWTYWNRGLDRDLHTRRPRTAMTGLTPPAGRWRRTSSGSLGRSRLSR
ncbi:MAG: NAD(P)H-dependent oxidoreductase [Nocardioidaceae bacterium]